MRRIDKQREEIEQLRVQLAGCSVVALGGTKEPIRKGDYGWSPSTKMYWI